MAPVIGIPQEANADTGGYPWAAATCQTSTQSYNGVAYCPNDNWVYNGGLYDTWGYNYRNCTSWVAWRLSTNNGYTMPRAIGDASAWGGYFSSHGVAVNSTPAVGAIAWESGGDHVAYVEAVSGSSVTISEYNEHYYPGNTTEGDGLYETRTVASSAFEYIHVKDLTGGGGGVGGGGGAPPPPYNTNLLSNASFEDGNFTSWGTDPVNGGTVNTAAYNNPSRSREGSWYGESNTSTGSGSITQQVAIAPQPGQSYTFSIWLRSPTGQPLSGQVTLWGLGGTNEGESTAFTVGSSWTLVSAPLDVQDSGHSALLAQVYMFTTDANYDFDGAQLVNDGLSNASFEDGNFTSWGTDPVNGGTVNTAAYNNPSRSREGSWYGESNTSTGSGSITQQVAIAPQPGQSYTFSIWLRSPTGQPLSGQVTLWGLGGTNEGESTAFTVGSSWTLVSAPLDVQDSGHSALLAQVYMFTTDANYDFDGAQLVNDGLSNASFEDGNFTSWGTDPVNGGTVNTAAYNNPSRSREGSWYGESNTSTGSGSITQQVAIAPQPGQSYTFSIWLRSPTGQPLSGQVTLWGLGGTNEGESTAFTVGSSWTLVSAPLDVQDSGHSALLAQVYMFTTDANYDFDGATFASGEQWTPNVAATIVTAASTTFNAGHVGSFSVTASGTPMASLSESGFLPSGVTFVDNGNGTATLAGTATQSGTFPITITASNGVEPDASQAFTLTVTPVSGGGGSPGGGGSSGGGSGPVTSPSSTAHGYWLVGSDGGIFTFGSASFYGSTGSLKLQRPVVGIVPTADRGGYWLDASDGGVFAYGDTQYYGSIPGLGLHPAGSGLPNSLNAPIVGMVPSNDDNGYFMVASDGGVFAFGDAHFAGSCPGIGGCSGTAVAVMPDHSGNGYWLVTSTGSVYTFGDAPYFGAPGHGTVTSAVATPDGLGYWVLLSNGQVYAYGDAANDGSPASSNFNAFDAASAIFSTSDGAGYRVSSAAGAVFNYGDAPADGGMTGTHLNGSIIAATGF